MIKRFGLPREQKLFLRQRKKMARKKLTEKLNRRFKTSFTSEQVRGICTRAGYTTGKKRTRLDLTEREVCFLREQGTIKREKLTALFNKVFMREMTTDQINSICAYRGIRKRRKYTRYDLTREQVRFLRQRGKMPRAQLCDKFNHRYNAALSAKEINDICKRRKIRTGRTGQFTKGQKPWHTGTKGMVKPNSGNFKKGNKPANQAKVGTETIRGKEGGSWIKIAEPNRWRRLAYVRWEKKRGPVPKGMMLRYIGRDRRKCNLRYLRLISKSMNARLNQNDFNEAPAELKKTIWTRCELLIEIGKRKKKNRTEKRQERQNNN